MVACIADVVFLSNLSITFVYHLPIFPRVGDIIKKNGSIMASYSEPAETKTFKKKFNVNKSSLHEKGNVTMNYGKYKGQKVGSVVVHDEEYAKWMLGSTKSEFMRKILTALLEEPHKLNGWFPELNKPAPKRIMPFGKYKGQTFEWVVDNDANYAEWCANKMNNPFIRGEMAKLVAQKAAAPVKVFDRGNKMTVQIPRAQPADQDTDMNFFDYMN